jgi:hypothetical protein
MMTTNGDGNSQAPKFYVGRTRGLRQGGASNPRFRRAKKVKRAGAAAAGGKPPLGTGARFKNVVDSLSHRPGVNDPKRLAAFIGQQKYGAAKMSRMAATSRKRG